MAKKKEQPENKPEFIKVKFIKTIFAGVGREYKAGQIAELPIEDYDLLKKYCTEL